MPSRFFILFDNPSKRYFPGQNVTGMVVFECTSPKIVQGLQLKFRGHASVLWTEGSRWNRIPYSDMEKYFMINLYLFGDGKSDVTIEKGRAEFLFDFQLPSDIPSSFEGSHGKVSYEVLAVLQRAGIMKNYKVNAQFTVNAIVDLNMDVDASRPSEILISKDVCCLWCVSGRISYILKIRRTGYVPGQFVFIEADCEMQNQSRCPVNAITLSLVQVIKYYAGKRTSREAKVLARAYHEGFQPGYRDIWRAAVLKIPPSPPTKLGNCRIIDVQYNLHLDMEIQWPPVHLRGYIPITIGTIPLRDYYPSILPQEMQPELSSALEECPDPHKCM